MSWCDSNGRPGVWVGLNTSIAWDQVNIQGPVYFGSSVKVEPGATVIGPTWIGHPIYRGNEASELC